jgi:hypothetical protein
MSDTPAKRQAYSFAFPPDKKQAFIKIADEKYQRPASWLLLAAIDQVIANGGLLGEEPSPAPTAPPMQVSTSISDVLVEYVHKNNWDDLAADVADLRRQLADVLTIDRVTEIARGEVELGLTPLSNDLVSLQSQLAEVKSDCELTTEGIQRLIADAISKASIATTTSKKPHSPAIRTTSAPGEVNSEVLKVASRLQREPALKSAVNDGLAAGHTGEKLGQYLADKGFMNGNGGKYTGASNSRFRLATEHLDSLKNGG